MRGSLPTASTNSWSVTLLWMTCCELQSIGIPTWPARDMGAALSCCAAAAATTRIVKRAKKSAFFIGVTSQCSRDLYKRGSVFKFFDHVRRPDPGACERLLAVRRRRAAHVAFHVCQPRAARAAANVSTAGAGRKIFQPDGTHFVHLWRIVPDSKKFFLTQVAGGQRELHAREHICVRRDVAGGMPRAAGRALHFAVVGRREGGTVFVCIAADQFRRAHQFFQFVC